MLSRSLLAEAVTLASKGGELWPSKVQRQLRVGFATAFQLVEALEEAQVLGPGQCGRRPVLVSAPGLANGLVAEAIDSGRIVLS